MHTLKKFIPYYSPYRAVFVLDLICAAMISLIDLAYPQILRTMTKTVFAGKSSAILQVLLPIGVAMLIMYIVQALCKYYAPGELAARKTSTGGYGIRPYIILLRQPIAIYNIICYIIYNPIHHTPGKGAPYGHQHHGGAAGCHCAGCRRAGGNGHLRL